ncbi:MAG: D-alanine--D-alanine ligase [Bacteroidetes bacterium]|nr:MAG: D-alanine--D-alanine ligase [Bacteroidota bacterium]
MKNIAIVCGGNSDEYEISIKSAAVVAKHLNKKKYKGYLIVLKGTDWYWEDENGRQHHVNKDDFTIQEKSQKVTFDGVFNAIHGTPGEDGKLQGYLDMLQIPYSSCNTATAALSFDKFLCNRFVNSYGIQTALSLSFLKGEPVNETEIVKTLGLPVFVKPAQSGSSVGVSKVDNVIDLKKAIHLAWETDERVIIEEAINGREIACGMINKGNELLVFPLTEIISKKDFFDYEAKYTAGMASEITPANISQEAETDIKTLSSFLYRQMNCKGFVRFDYILTPDNLYFLEVNSIPGISDASIIPQQAAAFGMSTGKLFDIAIENMFR